MAENDRNRIDIKIYYEDTDCGGVVYYGKYLGFLERARTEFLEQRGISLVELMKEGISFVVTRVEIDYRSSARYGDILSVFSEVGEMGAASVVFTHRIVRKDPANTSIATASVKLACVGPTMRPLRMKENITSALALK